MHVQRHNNVSILYADIVNFTPLSERLSASDLVKTLNELFGRFDQIAQVSPNKTNKFQIILNIDKVLNRGIVESWLVPDNLSYLDVVKMLNELFEWFDQITQVSLSETDKF